MLPAKQQDDSAESDITLQEYRESQDLQMVLEIWVEPQMGTVDLPDSPLSYIHGSEYNKIPQKVQCFFNVLKTLKNLYAHAY